LLLGNSFKNCSTERYTPLQKIFMAVISGTDATDVFNDLVADPKGFFAVREIRYQTLEKQF